MIPQALDKNSVAHVAAERNGKCSGYGSLITDEDLYLFNQGSYSRAYNKLRARRVVRNGVDGTPCAVWAPDADRVFVTGSFNDWDKQSDRLHPRGNSGIWEGFVAGVDRGELYKYFIYLRFMNQRLEKADPFSIPNEIPPRTASIVWIDGSDADASVMSLRRIGRCDEAGVLVVCNFTPVLRINYRVGAPRGGLWSELLSSDATEYGGSGAGNLGGVEAGPVSCQGRRYSLCLTLPPLSVLFLSAADVTRITRGLAP